MSLLRFIVGAVFLIGLSPFPVQGQISLGLGAGGSLSGQYLFRAGLRLEWSFRPSWALQTEWGITQRTHPALSQRLFAGDDQVLDLRQTYLEWPLLLKANIPLRNWELFILSGPQLSWLARLRGWAQADDRLEPVSFSPDRLEVRVMDVGWLSGLGIQKALNPALLLFAEMRYYLGLRSLDRDRQRSLYNQGYFFQIGMQVRLGRPLRSASEPTGILRGGHFPPL